MYLKPHHEYAEKNKTDHNRVEVGFFPFVIFSMASPLEIPVYLYNLW